MRLQKFRVTHFRSVLDSGWISCDNITTLVGINESGKSNILLALWKLNPARLGAIDPLHDLPVTELSQYEKKLSEVSFIEAVFILEDSAQKMAEKLGISFLSEDELYLKRSYDGAYTWHFNNADRQKAVTTLFSSYSDESGEEIKPKYTKKDLLDQILVEVPSFVYYSNYGNLASKIYLPHAVKWLKNEEIPGVSKNEDQLRTIRVLFDYVDLSPEEILEYGRDAVDIAHSRNNNAAPTKEEIQKAREAKEKRALLLQSAGTKLTSEFRNWWNQGEYQFRFQADGDYFQIWVSDALRPAEVDLELRSTGLQWFLSFYLIFLVESQGNNAGAVLLLDEAGLTLHPLAQKDLSSFFNKLSEGNQIINTTHSPFIIDTENIDRCRVVYSDEDGHTVVSEDLRKGSGDVGAKSIYAVHAALGLTVSDIMLQGSQVVIVEGVSDQFYLSTIKTALIREGRIKPSKELIFAPSGGVKGVPGITGLVSAKNDEPPFVILDSDSSGEDFKKKLSTGLYKSYTERVLSVKKYTDMEQSEIEDLIPYAFIEKGVNRLLEGQGEEDDDEFEYEEGKPILPQIESYAQKHNISLSSGWKVELARVFKRQVSLGKKSIPEAYLKKWEALFSDILQITPLERNN